MAHNERIQQIIESHYKRDDPTGWFEALYASADGQTDSIPWADEKPNPHLLAWLDREHTSGNGRTALVVGCGLGDDAEELAQRGFMVTGFDISSSAVSWCAKRWSNTKVKYLPADLLAPPGEFAGAFDFVFEAYTIQALPRSLRPQSIRRVASFVAPRGGELLIVCRGREVNEDEGSLPWPLSHEEMASFERHGLTRVSFENFFDYDREPPVRRFRALFRSDDKGK